MKFCQFKPNNYKYILGTRVDGTSYEDTINRILTQASSGDYGYACVANVHMIMEAFDSEDFRKILNKADIVTPDGMPIVLLLRILGLKGQKRVYGPSLMKYLCEASALSNISVGLYGGTPETLMALVYNLLGCIPNLKVGYTYSPPFHQMSSEEDESIIKEINASKIKILFVGLGCPKQERWMAAHHARVRAVMIGVGAGFDFFAGTKKQAPKWMMQIGLEWLFRLFTEPNRLWQRYLYNNPRFIFLAIRQILWERILRDRK
jgi:N-acetylglucosaminyldiphosphoundecaprenol N-acetyl-beta-D-mannosaminyltransferase